jgi:hypothetical protein
LSRKARLGEATREGPVLAQVAGIALDDATMTSVVAALGSNKPPVAIDRARIDRARLGDDGAARTDEQRSA